MFTKDRCAYHPAEETRVIALPSMNASVCLALKDQPVNSATIKVRDTAIEIMYLQENVMEGNLLGLLNIYFKILC